MPSKVEQLAPVALSRWEDKWARHQLLDRQCMLRFVFLASRLLSLTADMSVKRVDKIECSLAFPWSLVRAQTSLLRFLWAYFDWKSAVVFELNVGSDSVCELLRRLRSPYLYRIPFGGLILPVITSKTLKEILTFIFPHEIKTVNKWGSRILLLHDIKLCTYFAWSTTFISNEKSFHSPYLLCNLPSWANLLWKFTSYVILFV